MEPGNTHLGEHAAVSLKVTLKKTADGKYLVETANGSYARPDTNKASDRMIAAMQRGMWETREHAKFLGLEPIGADE